MPPNRQVTSHCPIKFQIQKYPFFIERTKLPASFDGSISSLALSAAELWPKHLDLQWLSWSLPNVYAQHTKRYKNK